MTRILSVLFLLFIGKTAHASDITPFIVNGSNANIANYPSFASLFYRTDTVYSPTPFCGATMINSQYVLTAAHCVYDDDNLNLYTVVAPQLDDESNFLSSQQARALEFYFPDSYIDSSAELWPDDIAIIKLESPLAVSDYSSLLNTSINNSFSGGGDYKAIGHGLIEGNAAGGTQLLEAALTYVNTATCQAEYGSKLTSSHLCFSGAINGGYRAATCRGDSGGPVYWYNGSQYIQIGITSFGPSTCGDVSVNATSVFTDVYDYQTWISRVINGQETPKKYVTTINGVRTLVDNTSTDPVTRAPSDGDGGGGALSLFALLSTLFVWRVRSPARRIQST